MSILENILLVSCSFLFTFSYDAAHDTPMANFHLTLNEESLQVQSQFDQEDLELAVLKRYQNKVDETTIRQYIVEHTQWILDQHLTPLQICSINKEGDHYLIQGELSLPDANLETIEMENTCLVKEIEHHSNIVYLKYQEKFRGFRLHAKRISTTIKL